MDYIGSKSKLNDWIYETLTKNLGNLSGKLFLDACAGSGSVSRYMASKGLRIISNDLMNYSKSLVNGSIGLSGDEIIETENHLKNINALLGKEGFFWKNYSPASRYSKRVSIEETVTNKKGEMKKKVIRREFQQTDEARLFFTENNAKRIDACRDYIETVKNEKVKDYLIYCGIEAISRVSNTAGVYGSFLKKFKSRALEPIFFKPEKRYSGCLEGVYSDDIVELVQYEGIQKKKVDLLYIDPPYNTRQYGNNYHIYEIFANNDKPKLHPGTAGLIDNWQDQIGSNFCSRNCIDVFKDIIKLTNAVTVAISYNSDGIVSKETFEKELRVKCFEKEYLRYKSDNKDNRVYNEKPLYEYLFLKIV